MNSRSQLTTNAPPRAMRVAAVVRDANARRTRRLAVMWGFVVVVLTGWHFLPNWKMYSLQSACAQLDAYRQAHGRFPASQAELEDALKVGGLFWLGAGVSFGESDLSSMRVVYSPITEGPDGPGYELCFNHDCFCHFGDTDRYRFYSSVREWETWYD